MAHWGIALSHWGNPFAGLKQGRAIDLTKAAIDKAQMTGSPTPRERGYIQAVAQLVTASDPGSDAARTGAYETAMEQVSRDNPADTEGRIFLQDAARGREGIGYRTPGAAAGEGVSGQVGDRLRGANRAGVLFALIITCAAPPMRDMIPPS